ncbi:hypothetical protein [Geofilum rhodophaeum]|uniref:hypothetical protein n=1 Tax=Geofilum rhodophaeum TaxID=1965019 RepID=UPI000B51EC09|nr:hypothetical protein [Geofilum rhodophaeum]
MQLARLSNKLKPLTLVAGMLSSNAAFAYSDIDAFSGVLTMMTNNRTTEYLQSVDGDDSVAFLQKFRFQNHLINWQNRTMFLSSTKAIIENDDFQSIVAMGNSAVPYILESIETNPSTLVWALNLIYNRKITDLPNITISEACNLWVKELKK